MGVDETNFIILERKYFLESNAVVGASLLDTLEPLSIEELLESHWLKEPSEEAVVMRRHVDALLAYYSIVEVGLVAGVIEGGLPREFSSLAQRHLSDDAVRRYYEAYYPLLLPSFLRLRVNDLPDLPVERGSGSAIEAAYWQLLLLTDALAEPNVEVFLWFLDDGRIKDSERREYGLSSLLTTLQEPEIFARCLSTPPTKDRPLVQSVHGMMRFLRVAAALDSLLQRLGDQPLLQSAFWHLHAYWFQQLSGQVGGVLATLIEQLRRSIPHIDEVLPDQVTLATESHVSMDRSVLAMRRLTSSVYRWPLERQYFEIARERIYDSRRWWQSPRRPDDRGHWRNLTP